MHKQSAYFLNVNNNFNLIVHVKQIVAAYSFGMLEYLFTKPLYTISDMEKNTKKHRNTCSKYLNALVELELLQKRKYKKENIFYNPKFLDILQEDN